MRIGDILYLVLLLFQLSQICFLQNYISLMVEVTANSLATIFALKIVLSWSF